MGHMKDAATAKAEDDYAAMLAARDGDDGLLLVDVEWDAISGGDGDLGGRR